MKDTDCVRFLQWALPRMQLRWPGFRKVRRQVCRRIARRIQALGLADADEYRSYLAGDRHEWTRLDACCRITISRFYRDRGVWESLETRILPDLCQRLGATGARRLQTWSAGCGCGEEPYTLALMWRLALAHRFPRTDLRILATDADPLVLERARTGRYGPGSLRELPAAWLGAGFEPENGLFRLKPGFRRNVTFRLHDVRATPPDGPFHVVLCRNLVFTYFDAMQQELFLTRLRDRLEPGGILVLGRHETLPAGTDFLVPWPNAGCVYRCRD